MSTNATIDEATFRLSHETTHVGETGPPPWR
jgi:hypothetical protein